MFQAYDADGSMRSFTYGAGSQSCSSGTYGLGYATAVTDEAGRSRQSWVDGFGRTIEADEPDANGYLTVNTCYEYDALNNLVEVDQGSSQTRTYSYDGLSRLTASTTPSPGRRTSTARLRADHCARERPMPSAAAPTPAASPPRTVTTL